MAEFIEIAKVFGVPVALLVFFVWWTYKRSQQDSHKMEKLEQKLDDTESYVRDTLTELVVDVKTSINQNTESNKELTQQFKARPCMQEAIR